MRAENRNRILQSLDGQTWAEFGSGNFIAPEAVVAVLVEIMLSVGQHMFVDPSKWRRCVIRLSQSRSELSWHSCRTFL